MEGANRLANSLRIAFWSSGIIFLWFGSAYYLSKTVAHPPALGTLPPNVSDLVTVFFGASSLAMIIFSLLLAVAAFIGWQSLRSDVRTEIEAAKVLQEKIAGATDEIRGRLEALAGTMEERTQSIGKVLEERQTGLEKELRGRVLSVIGFMIGSQHSDPDQIDQSRHKDYLSEAVWYCEQGYEVLKDLEGKGKYMALNNLVYYSCLYGEAVKYDCERRAHAEGDRPAVRKRTLPAVLLPSRSRVQLRARGQGGCLLACRACAAHEPHGAAEEGGPILPREAGAAEQRREQGTLASWICSASTHASFLLQLVSAPELKSLRLAAAAWIHG